MTGQLSSFFTGQLSDVALQPNSMLEEPNGYCSGRRTAKNHRLSGLDVAFEGEDD